MRIFPSLAVAALAALQAAPTAATEARYYPVPSRYNFCPAGLQPITLNGVICCGRPNTSVTWYEMKRHPVQSSYRPRRVSCPEGEKGCS